MKRLIDRRSAIALIGFAAGGTLRAEAQTLTPLRICTNPSDTGAQAYYAQDLGFLRRAGFDVQVTSLSNGAAIAAAVAAGTFDIGQSNTPSLATAHKRKLPFVMIALASLYSRKAPPAVGIVVAKNSAIHTGRDLNGKTMAVTGIRNIAQVAIQAWADKNGGDSSTIKFVEMPYRSMAPAIAEGRVDGGFLSEPDLDEALRTVGRSLGTGYDAIADNFVIGAWFCTREFASAHGDIVKRFATTMAETARWANSHRAQSAQILEKWTKTRVDASKPKDSRTPHVSA